MLDERKLIQHGMSSLTVSLPSKWLKERGLSKGDSVHVGDEGNKLIISTDSPLKVERISVDVSELDRTSILLYVQSLYRHGYNEIELKFSKMKARHYRLERDVTISSLVHYVVNRLIGVEIIEQTNNRILIKSMATESTEDFKCVLRRVFVLLEEAAENLLEGIEKNDMDMISTTEDKHDNITKFISYCLRLLNKYGYPDVKKTCFYYHIITSLDKVMYALKCNARDILKNKIKFSKETISIWKDANNSIKMYHNFFYNFDMKKVDKLSNNRDYVKKNIKLKTKKIPSGELVLLTRNEEILEILFDLTEVRMELEY